MRQSVVSITLCPIFDWNRPFMVRYLNHFIFDFVHLKKFKSVNIYRLSKWFQLKHMYLINEYILHSVHDFFFFVWLMRSLSSVYSEWEMEKRTTSTHLKLFEWYGCCWLGTCDAFPFPCIHFFFIPFANFNRKAYTYNNFDMNWYSNADVKAKTKRLC